MRTSRRIGIIGIMTVYTGDNTLGCQWRQKAWHVRVDPLRDHRVKGRVCKVELQPGVELIYLPGNWQRRNHINVSMTLKAYLIEILRRGYQLPANTYRLYTFISSGDHRGTWGCIVIGLVGVMTVLTLNMLWNTA